MQTAKENSKHKLQCKSGFGKEAVPETTSPGPSGFVTPTRREELTQILCRCDRSPVTLIALRRNRVLSREAMHRR